MKLRAIFAFTALASFATAGAEPPPPPTFGQPGDAIFSTTIALKHPKKSEDRAAGGAEHVFFTVWIPPGVKSVRGIYHTPFNLDTVEKEHSRAMAANWGFALVGGNFMRVHKDDFAPSLLAGLRDLAGKSGRAELAEAPMIVSGMSAGAGMARTIAELLPERVIACGLVCLEVGPESAATRDVPMMTIFGEKDGKQYAQLMEKLPVRRAEFGASWAIAPQWGRKHEYGKANHLLWTFFDEVIRQRLPADGSALRPCDPALAWLGNPATWTERVPAIASAAEYSGDKAAACWLPGPETARVWQSFAVKKPLIRIVSPAQQGDGKPLAVFSMNDEITVTVQCDAALGAAKLTLHDRTTPLAEGVAAGGRCELRAGKLAPGFHTFIVQAALDGGGIELSHPTTVLIQPKTVTAGTTND